MTAATVHLPTVHAFSARLENARTEDDFHSLSDEIKAAGLTAAVLAEMERRGQEQLRALGPRLRAAT